jgi:hypothetical protein
MRHLPVLRDLVRFVRDVLGNVIRLTSPVMKLTTRIVLSKSVITFSDEYFLHRRPAKPYYSGQNIRETVLNVARDHGR